MFDVAIIGGGLAGCMAAIVLAQRQHRVVLLEAGEYPRAKVCGELLSPESVTLFKRIGFLPYVQALHPTTIETLRITAPDGTEWRSRFPAPALGLSRYALDQALATFAVRCGVTLADKTQVTAIEGSLADGFCISARVRGGTTAVNAASVIATYGKRSHLDRALARSYAHEQQPYIGLKRHFRGAPLPHHIDLHVFKGGYCGISQVEDGRTNVCLLAEQAVFQTVVGHVSPRIEAFIDWICSQNRALGRWLADAEPLYPDWLSIGQVTLQTKAPIDGDILFAGDSAGMIAPLAGDGMAMALHSGAIAAQHIDGYLRHEFEAAALKQRYAQQWQRTFARRLQLGHALQSIMLRPRALSLGLRVLQGIPPLGDWMVRHTRDVHLVEVLP